MPAERGPGNPGDKNKRGGRVLYGGETDPRTSVASGEIGTSDEPGYEKTEIVKPFDRAGSMDEIRAIFLASADLKNSRGKLIDRENTSRVIDDLIIKFAQHELIPLALLREIEKYITSNEGFRDAVIREIIKNRNSEYLFNEVNSIDGAIDKLHEVETQNQYFAECFIPPVILRGSAEPGQVGQPIDVQGYINRLDQYRTSWLPSLLMNLRRDISQEDFNSFAQSKAIEGARPFTRSNGIKGSVIRGVKNYILHSRQF